MQPVEVVFDPHVSVALGCLLFAVLVAGILGLGLLIDWLERK